MQQIEVQKLNPTTQTLLNNPKTITPNPLAQDSDTKRHLLKTFTVDEKIDWAGSIPFFGVHVIGILAIFTGISWPAIAMCLFMYYARMFAITGIYHRYFSHRTYKTSRFLFQFVMAFWGTSCGQQGPLWWAAHHRHHHKFSDMPEDIHSPGLRGFWWAHWGWLICKRYADTNEEAVKDLAKYPELKFINKYHGLAPFILATLIFFFGSFLQRVAPGLHTNGLQMISWGFFTSTTLLYHGTFTINSLSHLFGTKRFETGDRSKEQLHPVHHYDGGRVAQQPPRLTFSRNRRESIEWEIDMFTTLRPEGFLLVQKLMVGDIKVHPQARSYLEAQGVKRVVEVVRPA